jgi:RimJ/RimL family protein N-acetyltransferase
MSYAVTTPVLETERLILRAPELADFDAYAQFFTTDRCQYVGGKRTIRMSWPFFCHHIGHWVLKRFGTFMITRRGDTRALGMIMAWHPEGVPEREVGWTIFDPDLEGTGIAREAASRVLTHVFHDLKWDTAVSYIAPANDRSVALAEKLGATLDPNAVQTDPADPDLIYRHPKRST